MTEDSSRTVSADRANPETVGVLLELASKRLDEQLQTADALDTKASIVVGSVLLLVISLVDRGFFAAHAPPIKLLLLAPFGVSAAIGVKAYWPVAYDALPKPEALFSKYRRKDVAKVKLLVLRHVVRAIERNRCKLSCKAQLITASIVACAAACALTIGIYVANP